MITVVHIDTLFLLSLNQSVGFLNVCSLILFHVGHMYSVENCFLCHAIPLQVKIICVLRNQAMLTSPSKIFAAQLS